MQNKPSTPNRWLIIFSPCVLGILFCIVVIAVSLLKLEESGGWSFIGIAIMIQPLLALIITDIVVKLIFRKKALHIWITELVLIAIGWWVFATFIYA
jgi:hypothetical protein